MFKKICICFLMVLLFAETAYGSMKDISDIFQKQIQSIVEHQEEKELEDFVTDDFVVNGSINSDMDPVVDYLALLEENEIYIKLPELLARNEENRDFYSFEISDLFYIIYVEYKDDHKISLTVEMPLDYKPKNEAAILLISSMLSISKKEANKIFLNLEYNMIDGDANIENDNCDIWLTETDWFYSICIDKTLDEEIDN